MPRNVPERLTVSGQRTRKQLDIFLPACVSRGGTTGRREGGGQASPDAGISCPNALTTSMATMARVTAFFKYFNYV
jgi:hypothetical protein